MNGRYWVDANSFIWGSRDPYPMPGAMVYWHWFEKMVKAGKVTSHKKVLKEVLQGEKKDKPEPIIAWVKSRQSILADQEPDSKQCQGIVGQICDFSYEKFGPTKTIEFTKGADPWLIARALLDDGAVVTQESDKKLVRIPTVCRKFDVPYKTLYEMNRELGLKLS